MTKFRRRIFLFSFVFLFAITVPIIILSSRGYRFDFEKGIFIYSGSITLKTFPRKVDIFLDGKPQEGKRLNVVNDSYTLNGIRPGRYHIRCQKDGYTSWEKVIDVHSGVSTEFRNVLLFPVKNQEKIAYAPPSVEQFFISPRNKEEIVYFHKEKDHRIVSLLDTKSNSSEEIFRTNKFNFIDSLKKENIEWSSDNKRILIPFQQADEKRYVIARIRRDKLEDVIDITELLARFDSLNSSALEPGDFLSLQTELKSNINKKNDNTLISLKKVRWMFDRNNELVILTKNNELLYIDIENLEKSLLIDTQVSGFDFAGNRIYYTQLPNNLLWEIKNNDISTKRQITTLPLDQTQKKAFDEPFLEITVYDQYRVAFETADGELYVYNREKEKGEEFFEKIMSGAKSAQFSNDGKKILYWSDNEIWCLLLRDWEVQPTRKKNDKIFITRFSGSLKNIQWMDDYENIIFSDGKIVKSAELDNRDRINIVDVFSSPDSVLFSKDILYDKETQLLYSRIKKDASFQLQSLLLIDKSGFLGI